MAAVALPQHETAPDDGDDWAETETQFVLSRATTRFALDLRRLSPVLEAPRVSKKKQATRASASPQKSGSPAAETQSRILSENEKDARAALVKCSQLATRARNVAMRALYRADSELFDTFVRENGGANPRGGDVAFPKAYSYPLVRKAAPFLASGMAATLAREVDGKWVKERRAVLFAEESSPPHYRVGQPFPVRRQDCKWRWDVENRRAAVAVQLFTGLTVNRFLLPIEARDAHQENVLRCLASGEWKAGEVQIERDRLRPSRWYMRVSYKRRIPKRLDGLSAAINRGMRFFLVALIQPTSMYGHGETWVYDGADIEATLKQFQRRRQSYQRQIASSGRNGHGRPRALKPIEHLTGVGERWRQTRCQTIARRLAQWLADRGVARVFMEDFAGIRDAPPELLTSGTAAQKQFVWERIQEWPYFQLGMRLKACLQEYGISVVELSPAKNSVRCPQCGIENPKNRDLVRWKLRCGACGYSRHLDVAFCANALQKAHAASAEAVREAPPNENNNLRERKQGLSEAARKGGGKPPESNGFGETPGNGNGDETE